MECISLTSVLIARHIKSSALNRISIDAGDTIDIHVLTVEG